MNGSPFAGGRGGRAAGCDRKAGVVVDYVVDWMTGWRDEGLRLADKWTIWLASYLADSLMGRESGTNNMAGWLTAGLRQKGRRPD